MRQPGTSAGSASYWRVALLLVAALVVSGCQLFGGGLATPTPAQPSAVIGGQQITIDAPQSGATIGSPVVVSGRTTFYPFEGSLTYRVIDSSGAQVANGAFQAQGEYGQPASFSVEIVFQNAQAGLGRIEVIEFSAADGSVRSLGSVQVNIANGGVPLPTGAAGDRQIVIDTPPPGASVGSPVVITGRTTTLPASGALTYVLRDAAGAVLGSSSFPITPLGDGSGTFNASLSFNLPPNGGAIVLALSEGVAGSAAVELPLTVDPPQSIVIDTPPPGTSVGSPVVITGRTARYPFQGSLAYRVLDNAGAQLGGGVFPVAGAPGAPGSFNASLTFNLPPNGGRVSVELLDQDATNNLVAARATIELNVAAPQQAIVIETPPSNTLVGSPVVITGRMVRFPASGQLSYRVRDARGQQIGQGQFGVAGAQNGGASFTASLTFVPPAGGGPIALELFETDPANGQVLSSATVALQVAGPAPPTATALPVPTVQAITIETPPAETVVGSPVVITGRAALFPRSGDLFYTIRTLTRETLGQGSFRVAGQSGQTNLPFNASLTFGEPAQGGAILVEIYDRDGAGQILASNTVRLQVQPRAQQPTATVGAGLIGQQVIVIETPVAGTLVGSPVVLTGRLGRAPANNSLGYVVRDTQGQILGQGDVAISTAGTIDQPFTVSISFNLPPGGGGIVIELSDIERSTGAINGAASVPLQVAAQ